CACFDYGGIGQQSCPDLLLCEKDILRWSTMRKSSQHLYQRSLLCITQVWFLSMMISSSRSLYRPLSANWHISPLANAVNTLTIKKQSGSGSRFRFSRFVDC